MSECKHPEAYTSIIGNYRVCNICGKKLPLVKEETKEEQKEEPKKRRRKAKDNQ